MIPKSKKKSHKKLSLTSSNTPLSQSDYTFTLTQIAVSQICQSIGFTTTTLSTLKTLTHITTLYLQTLAKTSVSLSNHSNRTQPNLIDIVQALHDLAGTSLLHQTHNPFSSKQLKDVSFFVNWSKEIPFAKPLVTRRENENWVKSGLVSERRAMHIPEWLPGFPEAAEEKEGEKGSGDGEGGEMVGSRVVECGGGGGELRKEREMVRFRIGRGGGKGMLGVERRSGVCIGGKRVCWH